MAGQKALGVDAGERRVGLAIADELGLLATPLEVLDRSRGLASVMDALERIVTREGVQHVVVGLPLNADGSTGRQARRSIAFAAVVRQRVSCPVVLWDERLSSQEAEAIIREQGRSVRRVRQHGGLDAVAAAVILQDYLDAQRRASGGPPPVQG